MKVGVLALQGDVREHIQSLLACGVEAVAVRRAQEIESVDALVLPGGESTTIAQLAEVFGILDLVKEKIKNGMPVYGSCAGMILLASEILDAKEGQKSFGGLDITVRRPVAVRSKTALATSFHPELTGDHRIHRYFIEQVARPALLKVK